MSMYLSFVPFIERTAAENRSAFPDAPECAEIVRPERTRRVAAALLRWTAARELAVAARLERHDVRRPATA